jgi:opacity protein-like surface antigen
MFLVSLNYTYVPIDEEGYKKVDELPEDASLDGGDLSIIYLSVGARYNLLKEPLARTKPYLIGGAGWYRIEAKDITEKSPSVGDRVGVGGTEDVFGVNIGVGTDISVSPTVNAFVEVQYQIGFTSESNTATVPVRLGFAFLLGQDS